MEPETSNDGAVENVTFQKRGRIKSSDRLHDSGRGGNPRVHREKTLVRSKRCTARIRKYLGAHKEDCG